MVSAIVLLKVARNKINAVAEKLAEMDGISEVFSVAGEYDLTAIIRVKDNEGLADLVTNRMLQIEGACPGGTPSLFDCGGWPA